MARLTGQVVAVRKGAVTLKLSNGEQIDTFTTHPLTFGEIVAVAYDNDTHTILYITPEGGSDIDYGDRGQMEIEEPVYDKTFYED